MSKRRRPQDVTLLGFISDDAIAGVLSTRYRIPSVDLDRYVIEDPVLRLVSRELCERYCLIPVARTGGSVVVAMSDPTNLEAIERLKHATGYGIEPVVATEAAIERAMAKYLRPSPSLN